MKGYGGIVDVEESYYECPANGLLYHELTFPSRNLIAHSFNDYGLLAFFKL
jgi:hypothetical protein